MVIGASGVYGTQGPTVSGVSQQVPGVRVELGQASNLAFVSICTTI